MTNSIVHCSPQKHIIHATPHADSVLLRTAFQQRLQEAVTHLQLHDVLTPKAPDEARGTGIAGLHSNGEVVEVVRAHIVRQDVIQALPLSLVKREWRRSLFHSVTVLTGRRSRCWLSGIRLW